MSGTAILIVAAAIMLCVLGGITALSHIYELRPELWGMDSMEQPDGRPKRKYEKPTGIFRFLQRLGGRQQRMERCLQ